MTSAAGILLVARLACLSAHAQTVAAAPAGFYKLDLLGNSDTIVSMPFTRPEAACGLVQSVSGNVVEVNRTTGWISNQFVYASGVQSNTYYAIFKSGAKEGNYYPITANGTNTLTLDLSGDSLATITNGTRLAVIPYWSFGTVFPNGKGIHASTSTIVRRTEALIPDFNGVGTELSPTAIYFYFTNTTTGAAAWRRVGSPSTNRNDDVLLPDTYVIIRHRIPSSTTLTAVGGVAQGKLATPLATSASAKQDNPVALVRPVNVSLNDSGLVSSGAFRASSSSIVRTDELRTFDNTTTNINKAPSGIYYFFNSGWRKVGTPTTVDFGTSNVFVPGAGFIIRKGIEASAPVWVNSPTY